jgi:hypothetical protein
VRANHVGIDGVPVQEILTRLEAAWGVVAPVEYPACGAFANACAGPRACSASRDELAEVQAFVDFAPLLAWRLRQNAILRDQGREPLPVSAAVTWCLARHPAFRGIRIASTVDVPPVDGLGRGVGVVVIRPADFLDHSDDGLARYAAAFAREVDLVRRRCSAGSRTLDAAALLAPEVAGTLLRHALTSSDRAFGSMGLSIIKDAKVFGAPLADVGQPDGFIAIGSLSLPTTDGRKAGCVCIKGPRSRIAEHPRFIAEAISQL